MSERAIDDVIRELREPAGQFGKSTILCGEAADRLAALRDILETPVLAPFAAAVVAEARHQVYRYPREHDAQKTAWDWFWTLGCLGSKASHAALARDWDKALHHTITAAAMLANWHRHITAAKDAGQ